MRRIVTKVKQSLDFNLRTLPSREILIIFSLKALTALLGFLILRYIYLRIDKEHFGVYQTLYVGISWAGFINFGLGNGVRNVVAKNLGNAKQLTWYFENALGIALLLFVAFSVIYTGLSSSFNMGYFFEGAHLDYRLIGKSINIFFVVILVSMLTALIKSTLLGIQKNVQSVGIEFFVPLLYLTCLIAFTHITGTHFNIYQLSYIFLGVNIVVCLGAQIYIAKLLQINFKNIFYLKYRAVKEFFGLGLRFFVLQIAALILYATDEFIISRYLGAEYVTDYTITKKVFWISTFLFISVSVPFWSRLTHLKASGSYDKILTLIKKYFVIFLLVSLVGLLLWIAFPAIVRIWLGLENDIDLSLVMYFFVYVLLYNWNIYVAHISNGLEIIKYQLFTAVIGAILNIPLSIYLGVHLEWGVQGILMASIISMLISGILIPAELVKKWKKMGLPKCSNAISG